MRLSLNRCVATMCCRSARLWLTAAPSNRQQMGVTSATCCVLDNNDNSNNNNSHDNVYGAVITTKVIARVHPVHLMNVD